jgi:lipopolysaccharide export system protein LptA
MKRLLLLLCLWAIDARAAEPVTVEAAGSLVWQQSDQTYRAQGDAVVTRGAMTLRADEIIAHYAKTDGKQDIDWLEARGNVQMNNAGTIAAGAVVRYEMLNGNVVLSGPGASLQGANGDRLAADTITFNEKSGAARAEGKPTFSRGDKQIQGDAMTAQFMRDARGGWALQRAVVAGNVIITSGAGTANQATARGLRGDYDAQRGTALLTGNVGITRGANQMNGARAEIDMNSGAARLLPDPNQPGGRVRALLVP